MHRLARESPRCGAADPDFDPSRIVTPQVIPSAGGLPVEGDSSVLHQVGLRWQGSP
jgi:hypothetical protein